MGFIFLEIIGYFLLLACLFLNFTYVEQKANKNRKPTDNIEDGGHLFMFTFFMSISTLLAWKMSSGLFLFINFLLIIRVLPLKYWIAKSPTLNKVGILLSYCLFLFLGWVLYNIISDGYLNGLISFFVSKWWAYIFVILVGIIGFGSTFVEEEAKHYGRQQPADPRRLITLGVAVIIISLLSYYIIKRGDIPIKQEQLLLILQVCTYAFVGGLLFFPIFIGRFLYTQIYSKYVCIISIAKPREQHMYQTVGYQCANCQASLSPTNLSTCPSCGVTFGGTQNRYKKGSPPPKQTKRTERKSVYLPWFCAQLYSLNTVIFIIVFFLLRNQFSYPLPIDDMRVYTPIVSWVLTIMISSVLVVRYTRLRGNVETVSYY